MRSRLLFITIAAFSLSACAPYRIDHRHLVLDETVGLVVLERSTKAVDSEGKPLKGGRTGFPVKATLHRENYEIRFDIPASSTPMIFLSARAADGTVLVIEGAYLPRVHPDAEVLGYEYSFYVEESNGAPIEFVIRNADGAELGHERLTYKIRSRGRAYGIDWI